jgi:tRNA(Ile)-lysidine synthase TilS/MesJ
LIAKHRGKSAYECIIPFSGDKDSTYQLYYSVKEYSLKSLVVRFNHGIMRSTIQSDCQRTFMKLSIAVLEFIPTWRVVKKVMSKNFKIKAIFVGIVIQVFTPTRYE